MSSKKKEQKQVFFISPIRREYDDVLLVVRQTVERLKAVVYRVDEMAFSGSVIAQIYNSIESADLIICDVSENIGNVMYELGYAHALQKPVIVISRKESRITFDIASTRTLIYDRERLLSEFPKLLETTVKSGLEHPEDFILSHHEVEQQQNRNLFISYSHRDKECLDRLLIHLKPLEKEGLIDLWVDTKLRAGEKWKVSIEKSLKSARVAILLVSADFLASDFIVDNELPPLLETAEAKGTRIIPLIVKPCRFARDKNLSVFQAINDPQRPLIKLSDAEQEELYDQVSALVESYVRTA